MSYFCVEPQDYIRKTFASLAVDTCGVLRIKYIGSQVAAHISTAATTGDITFEQGATTAAAAVGTGDNPGTSGVINISDLSTIHDLWYEVNFADDWEAWFEDYIPNGDIEVTAGNCIYIANETDQDCTGTYGKVLLADTSLETAEIFPVGVTLEGPASIPHSNDRQVLIEVLEIQANVTFGGATAGIKVFECSDRDGTSVQVDTIPLVTATATTKSLSGVPIYQTRGKRLVFQATDASGAITPATMSVAARLYPFGPSMNAKKAWSNY